MAYMAAVKTRGMLVLAMIVCLSLGILVPVSHAQAPETPATPQGETDSAEAASDGESFATSFVDGIYRTGRRFGFSVGVFHVYSADESDQTLLGLNNTRVMRFTSANPRIFTQFQGRRSVLRLDYGVGYRMYERSLNLDNLEHSAAINYDRTGRNSSTHMDYMFGATNYDGRPTLDTSGHSASFRFNKTLSSQLSFDFADQARRYSAAQTLRSAFDSGQFSLSGRGYGAALESLLQDFIFRFGRDIYLGDEQVNSNYASAGVSYKLNRRINLRFTGSHDLQIYEDNDQFDDLQALQIGVRGDYRINEWLLFDAGYTTYLGGIDEGVRGTNIHRLQIGGFRHRTRSRFDLAASGGVDYSRTSGLNQAGASVYASASKSTERIDFALSYHHGLSVVNGPGSVLNGDDVSATMSTWISRRINVGAAGSYLRGRATNSAVLENLTASGNIGVSLQRHLLLSVQGSYRSQSSTTLSFESIDRYAVSAGLHYFLPPLHR